MSANVLNNFDIFIIGIGKVFLPKLKSYLLNFTSHLLEPESKNKTIENENDEGKIKKAFLNGTNNIIFINHSFN